MTDRQYPIGRFEFQESYTLEELSLALDRIAAAPAHYRKLVEGLADADALKTYREGSWTVRQLVHHVADIQLLHFLRMKKAITEPDYEQVTLINMDAWAGTVDGNQAPLTDSLEMLEGITRRYVLLAGSLTEEQFAIRYFHPVRNRFFNQKQALAISSWHLRHHLAHIKLALGIDIA